MERWYGGSWYLVDWGTDDFGESILQWHDIDGSGPPLAIQIYDNHIYLTQLINGTRVENDLGTVVSNEWIDFVIHVKWSASGTLASGSGQIECWRNGVKLVDKNNLRTNSTGGSYIKLGMNKWNWAPPFGPGDTQQSQRIFYIDEFRIGDASATYNDVAPPATGTPFASRPAQQTIELAAESTPKFMLLQNYPNPFSSQTLIRYTLPVASQVNLSLFDVSGRLVKVLVSGGKQAGSHALTFNAGTLGKGIYYYKLQAGKLNSTGKMVIQ
jgi:hypothetical protein